jgi:hypothetical protein
MRLRRHRSGRRSERGRPSDQRETASHAARVEVALGAAISVRTLPVEDAEKVAFIRDRLAANQFARITRVLRRVYQRSQRGFALALAHWPVKAVMVPLGADQACGIDARSTCLLGAIEIIALSVDAGEQRADSGQLVAADPPVDDGLRPRLCIEGSAPIALDELDRKRRPVVRADIQLCASGPFGSIACFSS